MEEIKCVHIGQLEGAFEMANRVYSPDGLCPTIRTMQGGGLEPKIVEDFYKNREARECEGVAPTLRSERQGLKVVDRRVRKLTARECWRLMGFTDEDFDRASKALNDTFYGGRDKSSSQLYKQAGNSIVVNNLTAILENLF